MKNSEIPEESSSEKSQKTPEKNNQSSPCSLVVSINSAAVIVDKEDYDTMKAENERLKKENEANRLEIKKLETQIEKKDQLLSQTQNQLVEKDRYISKLIDEDIAILKAGNIFVLLIYVSKFYGSFKIILECHYITLYYQINFLPYLINFLNILLCT